MTTPQGPEAVLAFVETFPSPLFCFDLEFRCLWLNAAAARLTADVPGSPLGQPLDLLGPVLTSVRPQLEHVRSTRQSVQDAPVGSAADALPGPAYTATVLPVFSPDGTFFAVGCVLTDVTHLRRVQHTTRDEHPGLHRQLQQQAAHLQELDAELESYLAALAHDIQAPLRRIQGFLGLLDTQLGPQLTERSAQDLQVARQQSAQLEHITTELQQFQRVLRQPFRPVPLALGPLVHQTRHDLEAPGEDLPPHWEIGVLPVVLGDVVMLKQAFMVLLQAALTLAQQAPDARIRIWADTTPDTALLFIRTTGPALLPATVARAFQSFGRLPDPLLDGAGMDLSAVRRIVLRHGGNVSVESEEHLGTTFQVRLPLSPTVPPTAWDPLRSDERLQDTGLFSPGEAQFLNSVFGAALHQADTSIIITDAAQHIVYVNPSFTQQTGYTFHEVIGRNPRFLQGAETDPAARQVLRDHLLLGKPVHQLILNYGKDGQPVWFHMHVSPLYEDGQLRFFVALQENATERIQHQAQVEWNAVHDPLTGVRNRHGLDTAIRAQIRTVQPFALLIFDLDNLKQINDQHGHSSGDEVIRRVAQVLISQVRPSDQVFRLGGDEFLVLLSGEGETGAQVFITRIQGLLAQESGTVPGVSVSVGTALYPEDEQEAPHLIRIADERMYRQKMGRASRRTAPP